MDGKRIPASRDFDPATGKLKDGALLLLTEQQAEVLLARLDKGQSRVSEVENKPYTTRPYPPFTTSTLQQEANRKYGFTARMTMQVAQSLYETGHITYMRTDSTNLASVAIDAARAIVMSHYGPEYLPDQPRLYRTKVKNAQEAHEAIRPAGHPFDLPEKLRSSLTHDEFRLYDLIWKRTIASQMADARGHRMTITVDCEGVKFQVSGKTIEFPGYLRAYVEGSDDPEAELADRETILPSVTKGEPLACRKVEPKMHATKSPARFSEATLTRTLEEKGIEAAEHVRVNYRDDPAPQLRFQAKRIRLCPPGSPSPCASFWRTICPTWSTIRSRPRWRTDWTRSAGGKWSHLDYLTSFYFGGKHPGLKRLAGKQGRPD